MTEKNTPATAPTTDVVAEVTTLPSFRQEGSTLFATAAELKDRGFSIEGREATIPEILNLAKTGIFKSVGIEHKIEGKRGPQGRVYRVPLDGMGFTMALK